MNAEQSGSSRRPLALNDRFIERINILVAEITQAIKNDAAARVELPLRAVEEFIADQSSRTKMIGDLSDLSFADYQDYADRRKVYDKLAKAERQIESDSNLLISISFAGGYSVQINEISKMKCVISDEYHRVESIFIYFGIGSRSRSFSLTISNSLTTARFSVRGSKQEVEYYSRFLKDTFRIAEPTFPLLHTARFQLIASGLLGFLVNLFVVSLMSGRLTFEVQPGILFPPIIVFTSSLFQVLTLVVTYKLIGFFFPKMMPEYGRDWENRKSRLSLAVGLFTAVIIPAVLALIFG